LVSEGATVGTVTWGTGRRWSSRAATLLLVTVVLWLSAGGTAQAHPVLLRSTPADGQTLQTAPRQLDLWFSEPPTEAGIEISLSDRDGKAIPLGTTRIADRGIHLVVSGFPALARSVYELRWSVVSKYDLHRLQGTLVFGVGLAATSTGGPARSLTGPAATVVDVVLGWLDLAATAVLCGWVFLAMALARRRSLPEPVAATMLRLAVAFGFLSAFTVLVRTARQWSEAYNSDSGLAVLKESGQLGRCTLRELAVVGILVVLIRTGRNVVRPAPVATTALMGLVLADVVLRSASSHAQSGPVSLAVLSLHTTAALTWIGGLVVLGVLTAQLGERRADALPLWKSFGPAAAGSVAVLSVTGLLLAGRQVATVDAALGTGYGRALLIKLLIVAALMGLGLRHARRMHPWLTRVPARRPATPTARGQVVAPLLGVGVLLFAVVLAVTPPARGPQFDRPTTVASRTSYQVDDLLITVSLGPNQPGRSLLIVDAVSSRRPAPDPITAMTADLGTTTGIVLRRATGGLQGNVRWQAAVDVEATGDLPLRILAVRSHPGPATVSATWSVPTGLPPRPVILSNRPLAPWTNAAALALAVLSLVTATILASRLRGRTGPVTDVRGEPKDLAGTRS